MQMNVLVSKLPYNTWFSSLSQETLQVNTEDKML